MDRWGDVAAAPGFRDQRVGDCLITFVLAVAVHDRRRSGFGDITMIGASVERDIGYARLAFLERASPRLKPAHGPVGIEGAAHVHSGKHWPSSNVEMRPEMAAHRPVEKCRCAIAGLEMIGMRRGPETGQYIGMANHRIADIGVKIETQRDGYFRSCERAHAA
nr:MULTISPECIES: hypothetical protein [unclassified Sphingomonas]